MLVSFDPRDDQDANDALDIIIQFMGVPHVNTRCKLHDPATPHTVQETPAVPNAETAADAAETVSHTATPVTNGADTALDAQAGVELDANGSPWLAEVHATTKTQTKKGVWKKKRGLDDETVAAAEAAARAKIAGTPQPVIPTDPVVPAEEMPQATVTIDEVSAKWVECVEAGTIDQTKHAEIYGGLGIDGAQLAVNETMRRTLYDWLCSTLQPAPTPAPALAGLPGM